MNRRLSTPSRLNRFSRVLDGVKEDLRLYGLAHNGNGVGFLGLLRNVATSGKNHDRKSARSLASLGENSQPSSIGTTRSKRINSGRV